MGLLERIARLVRRFRDGDQRRRDTEDFRRCRFETMEGRRLLSADPIRLGATYVEEDLGSDAHGDTFEITFVGGAAGTQLARAVINGDQSSPGFGPDDVFFDSQAGGLGADNAFPFQVVSLQAIDPAATVNASVQDGTSNLVLDFQRFQAGDKLVFSIDVDEVEDFDPAQTDPVVINDGMDPITSAVEFQTSKLTAFFTAPHYYDASGTAEFRNRYDDLLIDTGLNLSADNAGGKRDRSDGAVMQVGQSPLPIAISGTVFVEKNLDLVQNTGEPGLPDVELNLWQKQGDAYVFTGHSTRTDNHGDYHFGTELGLLPGVYQVRETQPVGLFSVGAIPGTVDGTTSGTTVVGNRDVLTEIQIPLGGQHSIESDFAEAEPASVSGYVYHDRSHDGRRDAGEEGLADVSIQIIPIDTISPQVPLSLRTNSSGFYEARNLVPGMYRVVEPDQPSGYFDGLDRPGTVDGVSIGVANNPGDRLEGIVLGGGQFGSEYNFGEISPASISGFVYHDANNNGLRKTDEAPVVGVEIELRDASGQRIGTTKTSSAGFYEFQQLSAGTYTIVERQPAGWLDGRDTVGTVDGATVGIAANDELRTVTLGWGQAGVEYNFGELLSGSLSGRVHLDTNGNCILEAGEQTLSGVTIQLLNATGQTIATTTTDANGIYRFGNLVPGLYGVRELQPADAFNGDHHAGSHGGDNSQEDLIISIPVGSGQDLVNYDFCELPPARLSGYVFQDGPTIVTANGLPPTNLGELRDGQLTADDKPLAGVLLQLRDGFTGRAIDASEALPGSYPAGAIQVRTDAQGQYEFRNIPGGRSYAIYEIQPEGFVDSIDTVGTTTGFAFNPQLVEQTLILEPLADQPAGDAIIRIAVGPGQSSENNNFSEVQVTRRILPPPPPLPPLIPPPPAVIPPRTVTPISLPARLDPPPTYMVWSWPRLSVYEASSSVGYSWHLSVVNGGMPRDLASVTGTDKTVWRPAMFLEKTQWQTEHLRDARWLVGIHRENGARAMANVAAFGIRGSTPITGDFDGDGKSEIGVFFRGEWFLDLNGNGEWDEHDLWAKLGDVLDLPVVGDWDGDGKDDIGIYGPEWFGDQRQILREPGLPDSFNDPDQHLNENPKNLPPNANEATDGERLLQLKLNGPRRADVIDHVFRYGADHDIPVAGDWNGDGIRTIGVFRDGQWRIDSNGDGQSEGHDPVLHFGRRGDIPVVGDWDGNGVEELGVYRSGTWILDVNGNRELDAHDTVFEMGGAEDRPVVGDWNGDGIDEPGLYREVAPPRD